jgi:hypothetical protein
MAQFGFHDSLPGAGLVITALGRRERDLAGKPYGQGRFDGSFDVKRNRLTGVWELKGPKAGWQPWIELRSVGS